MPALAARRASSSSTTPTATTAQRRWVGALLRAQVRPLLVPVGLDPSHPFPQVANKSLNFIVRLGGKDAFGRENTIAIVKVPRVLPRVIQLPASSAGGEQAFVLLTSVIRAHLGELFPGREVEAFSQFRVTRDSDLEVDEDDVTNLRQALRPGLTTRHFGQAVRLEVVNTCPSELSQFLLQQFDLPPSGAVPRQRAGEPGAAERADRPRRRAGAALPAVRAGVAGDAAARAVDLRAAARRATCCCTSRSSRSSRWCSSCARRCTTPTCWRSSRPSTAPAASRR